MEKRERIEVNTEIAERGDLLLMYVGQRVGLKRNGSNYLGLCPFHNEKSPSFVLNDRGRYAGRYKCFGCGESGNIFSFVMKELSVNFVDAAKHIQSQFPQEKVITNISAYFLENPNEVKEISYLEIQKSLELQNDKETRCNFMSFLCKIFGVDVAYKTIQKWNIGTNEKKETIFWYRDYAQRFRKDNVMKYNIVQTEKNVVSDLKRDKNFHIKSYFEAHEGYSLCLFGEHQITFLKKYGTACIVESEKTAVIMSILYPEFVWLASKGMQGISLPNFSSNPNKEVVGMINEYNKTLYECFDSVQFVPDFSEHQIEAKWYSQKKYRIGRKEYSCLVDAMSAFIKNFSINNQYPEISKDTTHRLHKGDVLDIETEYLGDFIEFYKLQSENETLYSYFDVSNEFLQESYKRFIYDFAMYLGLDFGIFYEDSSGKTPRLLLYVLAHLNSKKIERKEIY